MASYPGDKLNLSETTEMRLVGALCELLTDVEDDHSDYLRRLDVYQDWWSAKPLQQVRTDPCPHASNVVIPIIRTAGDAISARVWGSMHAANGTWLLKSANEDEQMQRLAHSTGEFLNLESRNSWDILMPTFDWSQEMVAFGTGVLGMQWCRKVNWRFHPGRKTPQAVEVYRGPDAFHIPRWAALWERDRTIEQSSYLCRLSLLNYADMSHAVSTAGWDADKVRKCEGQSGVDGPLQGLLNTARNRSGQREAQGVLEPHDIREVWVEWPLADLLSRGPAGGRASEFENADPITPRVPVVLTLHRKARQLLRAVAHPYYFYRWPFLDIYFRKNPGRGDSEGVCQILEQNQRAVTALVNQSIDGVTFANSVKIVTSDPTLKNFQFKPRQPIYTQNVNETRLENLSGTVIPDIALINLMVAMGERVIGISDPNLGRETRLGGHPSPATNTLVQLEEGAKVLSASLKLVRQQLGTAGEWAVTLYQQFGLGDTGKLAKRLGAGDTARLSEMLIGPENILVDVQSMSETSNADSDRQNAVMVSQMTSNYYGFVLRMLAMAENPQTQQMPKVREAALAAVEAYSESFIRFLRASDVDDPDSMIFDTKELRDGDISAVSDFRERAAALLGGGQAGPPGAPVGNSRGNGAASLAGELGPMGDLSGAYGGGVPEAGGAFG